MSHSFNQVFLHTPEQRSNWYENVKAKYLGKLHPERFKEKGQITTIATLQDPINDYPHPDDHYKLLLIAAIQLAPILENKEGLRDLGIDRQVSYLIEKGPLELNNLKILSARYGDLYNYSLEISDEWKKIADADRSEKVRNVVFRFIQTIAVGFAFVLVLEFAHFLKIPLILFK